MLVGWPEKSSSEGGRYGDPRELILEDTCSIREGLCRMTRYAQDVAGSLDATIEGDLAGTQESRRSISSHIRNSERAQERARLQPRRASC